MQCQTDSHLPFHFKSCCRGFCWPFIFDTCPCSLMSAFQIRNGTLPVKFPYPLKGVQKVTCLHAIKPTNCGGWGKYFLILDAENRNTKQSQKKTEEIRKPLN